MIGVTSASTLILLLFLPCCDTASSRISAMLFAGTCCDQPSATSGEEKLSLPEGLKALTKIASALFAANCLTALDVPAWSRSGVRCGLGWQIWGPGTVKYLPLWLISRTRSGTVYTPFSRSRTTASSLHDDSKSLYITSTYSSA